MHCINIHLAKKSEIESDPRIKFKELEQGIVAILDYPGIEEKDLLANRLVASINTDYFGGAGSQSASVTMDGNVIYEIDDEEFPRARPINEALRLLGVRRKDDMDEFDTIGLGNYRTNQDFQEPEPEPEIDEQEEEKRAVAIRMKQEGFDYCFRLYSDFEEIEDREFHKLREAYIDAANKLEKYVNDNFNNNG
jgi:hypothetical protein